MRLAPIISLVLSVALGIAAIWAGRTFLSGNTSATAVLDTELLGSVGQDEVVTVKVAVSDTLIETGDPLDLEAVHLIDWPEQYLPEGAITDLAALPAVDGAAPFALGVIVPGEPLVDAKLSAIPDLRTLAAVITPGMRAVSISVNDVTGVAGFILPDDRVDVSLVRETTSPTADTPTFTSSPILKNVRVLAVDQSFDTQLEGAAVSQTVTLETSQTDADKLFEAVERGNLSLTLRSEDDAKAVPPPAPPPRPRRVVRRSSPKPTGPVFTNVRVIQGSEAENVQTPVAPPVTPPVQLVEVQ